MLEERSSEGITVLPSVISTELSVGETSSPQIGTSAVVGGGVLERTSFRICSTRGSISTATTTLASSHASEVYIVCAPTAASSLMFCLTWATLCLSSEKAR